MNKKPVKVAVSGAFDPLHVGHIRYIHEAAKLGDFLVVILNRDDFLLKKKGFVFWPFNERKEILENIKCVGEVVAAIDNDQTVRKTLELVKPDIFAKGGDWTGPGDIPENDTCRMIGCRVVTHVGGGKVRADDELSRRIKEIGIEHALGMKIACPYCDDHPMLKARCLYCGGTGKIEVGKADYR
jgi:cytidyltransferase-like protein